MHDRTHIQLAAQVVGATFLLVLTVYGSVIDHHSSANFVPVNGADNLLHLVLGVGMIALGLALGRTTARTSVSNRG